MGTPHPVSKRLELHNTWLVSCSLKTELAFADAQKADGLKHYVDWAAAQGFGVIDVNVPKHVPAVEVWYLLSLRYLISLIVYIVYRRICRGRSTS